jgi:hypothetical protein
MHGSCAAGGISLVSQKADCSNSVCIPTQQKQLILGQRRSKRANAGLHQRH